MKTAILMLSYERFDILQQVLPHNLRNAGVAADLFVIDQGSKDPRVIPFLKQFTNRIVRLEENIGIPAGFNRLMSFAYELGYTHFQLMANDILEQPGWISQKLHYFNHVPNSGMVSIACGDHGYPATKSGQLWLHPGDVIGQFMISRELWEAIGAFREDYGMYAPIDNDYNIRATKAGFTNYYLPVMRAVHLDDGNNELYGYDKAGLVRESWPKFIESLDDTRFYIAPGEVTMNAKEYVQ